MCLMKKVARVTELEKKIPKLELAFQEACERLRQNGGKEYPKAREELAQKVDYAFGEYYGAIHSVNNPPKKEKVPEVKLSDAEWRDILKSLSSSKFPSEASKKFCEQTITLMGKKHEAYASHIDNIELMGLEGVGTRLIDKVARLNSLIRNENLEDLEEPLKDTITDILGYAIIAHLLESDQWGTHE